MCQDLEATGHNGRLMQTGSPTFLLRSWRDGDRGALDRLMPLVYDELSRIARGALSGERRDHTLQTRALVHEVYIRLIDADVEWKDRAHFFALAARAMRRILTDHAKGRARAKRGGNPVRVELADIAVATPGISVEFLDLENALEKLAIQDERCAQLVELHFYGGLDYDESAEALGISPATVGRELRLARAFIARELGIQPA
jgi:RNA polymerase sigma-70 factor (ECF subfamily)